MIRFCDKKVFNIIEGDLTRGELLSFFLSDNQQHITDVVAVYAREDEALLGIVTYDTLLSGTEGKEESYINTTRICVGERFWDEANAYFEKWQKELLTVVDASGTMLGFAYYEIDSDYWEVFRGLEAMEELGLPILQSSEYQAIKMMVITDLNEMAFRCYQAFKKVGLEICVIGEKWEWFGLKSGEGYLDYAEFEKFYVYAEGNDFYRKEKRGVKHRFSKGLENFMGIVNLFLDSSVYTYREEAERLAKSGLSICEVNLPSGEEILYRTELELLVKPYKIETCYEELEKKSNYVASEAQMQILERIIGKKVIDAIKSNKGAGLAKAEDYRIGEFIGKTVTNAKYARKLYLLGPCIVAGRSCIKEETLVAYLQERVKDYGYLVVGVTIGRTAYNSWKRVLQKLSICKDDIVVIVNSKNSSMKAKQGFKSLDVSYIYNNPERETLCMKDPIHSNARGNEILANEIYNHFLKEHMEQPKSKERRFVQKGEVLGDDEIAQVSAYVENIRHETKGTVGAIVMNCNPFTYGHQYLIEYASDRVDWLYVFVVEENRSFFEFEERFDMVKKGTAHLRNVIVVPSGRFVLSYETMPIYFEKAEKQEMQVDARMDLEIFARYIAPPLHITKRFVGEEPTDKVTLQYNQQMQEIFEPFDLALEIIRRKELNGQAISASGVRKYMKEGKWEAVKQLVPETTYERLEKSI